MAASSVNLQASAGDPLSAAAWNAIVQAVMATPRGRALLAIPGVGVASRDELDRDDEALIPFLNLTGAAREATDVVGISGPLISPTNAQTLEQFCRDFALKGRVPIAADIPGQFGIVEQHVDANAMGLLRTTGRVVVYVHMLAETHRYAEAKIGDSYALESADSGSIQLLWVCPPAQREQTGYALCYGRFGGAGGAGSSWQWARITSVSTNTFQAKLLTADGVTGDPFEVNVFAAVAGLTTSVLPDLSLIPFLQIGADVGVEYRGGDFRPGWWLARPNVSTTCTEG